MSGKEDEPEKKLAVSIDSKSLQGDCQIPASGLDLALQTEQSTTYRAWGRPWLPSHPYKII